MKCKFKTSVELVGTSAMKYTEEHIKNEPMLFSSSLNFFQQNAGPISKHVMQMLLPELPVSRMAHRGYHPVVDTKVVMLKPGQLPCIGGWHCDAIPRNGIGQPDMDKLDEARTIPHYVYVDTPTRERHSGTIFLAEELRLDVDPVAVWHSVNRGLDSRDPVAQQMEPGKLVKFYGDQLHRGPACVEAEWRYFFRLSFMATPCRNEIRRQVQVYQPTGEGW